MGSRKRQTPITEIAGYSFSKPSLLMEALTHPSLDGRVNYQRFEFLGDRVLGLVMAEWLLHAFPSEPEGQLNRRFISLVRAETLAELADDAGFTEAMLLAASADTEGTRSKMAVRSDIFEAVIGAMYLDGGFEPVRAFLHKQFAGLMEDGPKDTKDAKTRVQEWAQKRGLALPTYTIVDRSGPDHAPTFTIEAALGDRRCLATGTSRKIAEQSAAEKLYSLLKS